MKVEELIIDGFKSYATRTVISGWDSQFNAITGLNGSGKSNILDAICFVLGISSMTTVRASNLQDLIYKRGQAGVTKASVTIVFDNSDTDKSPIGFEKLPSISVTRQIVLGGTSKYLINGHRAQQQTVLQLFQSVQLNINNPNFLIMQGKITKVLNMKPTEILSLIEEAAGTKMYEDRREKAEKTMSKKDVKLREIRSLLEEEITPKLDKLANERRVFLEFQQIQTDLEKLTRVVAAHDYKDSSKKYDHQRRLLDKQKGLLGELESSIEQLEKESKSIHEEINRIKEKRKTELSNNASVKELEKQETIISNELARLVTSHQIKLDTIKSTNSLKQKHKSQIKQMETTIEKLKEKTTLLEKEYQNSKDSLTKLKQNHSKREDLLSSLSTGISSQGISTTGYASQLRDAKKKHSDALLSQEQLNMQSLHLQKEIETEKTAVLEAEKENKVLTDELERKGQEYCTITQKLNELGFHPSNITNLQQQKSKIEQQIYKATNELENSKRRVANLDFHFANPSPQFDRRSVKGTVAQLFTVDEKNMKSVSALEVCAGGKLYNVVVDTQETASQLLKGGQLKKRVTFIPLNKISAYCIDPRKVQQAKELCPGKVELALNLITYDKDVEAAMKFTFGGRLVCDDADTAKKITFHPQIRARTVTLNGDTYDPEGTLTGGSRNNVGVMLTTVQKCKNIEREIANMKKELLEMNEKQKQQQGIVKQTESLQQKANKLKHEISLGKKNQESHHSTITIRKNAQNISQLEEINEKLNNQNTIVLKLTEEIAQIEKDIQEFGSDKSSKLKQLADEVKSLASQIPKAEETMNLKYSDYQQSLLDLEKMKGDLDDLNSGVQEKDVSQLNAECDEIKQQMTNQEQELDKVRGKLEDERQKLLNLNDELDDLNNELSTKHKLINENKLETQKLSHEIEKVKSVCKAYKQTVENLIKENEWVSDSNIVEKLIEENPSINVHECYERIDQLKGVFQGMKRKVNSNIMSIIENVEKKEGSLKQMIRTIEKDKAKIEETINKLNEYKKITLIETWKKVSEDFGNIFRDLLPNSFAKLVPPENKDVTDGLEVKVMLGKVWKESLVELSGGQRSLIALSLILALLQFKPAPMYILDEVDAALDLSHTQNIGHLIKTRFKGSQFIVVSLKEGMFTNANRVFRTRFQDGTSVVSAT
ncbi:Condensin complex subunit [Komagataella phaffii CBS 7435]|uniref:Condensin complex subunit n=1 Tax=Komagataella phaffii (strain ATCC 76273 / CBS 7435 / CECT 11047 / NRRL Y-11430 / Wegner 21-1) TaxID=981350 RepID=F2R080_KOMPC|nr:GQ67_04418T0 [Komagataella phaffii]AOA69887.1 GQ68_04390T0 [Komagataella phaffii GS115]CAH2451320.1 Condensin complex subunit [Komagataella phaffii CBS 7435]CCA41058.1 Condensin complex subunit [Komagataella phaffii CBS 7435]